MVTATALALTAAVLHAAWNLMIKTSSERFLAAWGQLVAAAVLFLPVLLVTGPPGWAAWVPLLFSTAAQLAYMLVLVGAYNRGDFSMAYPMARGGGALLTALGGAVLIGDELPVLSWAALGLVTLGLVTLVRPGGLGAPLTWALVTALLIATYTLIDSVGARRTSGFGYVVVLNVTTAIGISIVGVVAGRWRDLRESLPASLVRYLASGFLTTLAYGLVLVAVRLAPVGYVATLRESSIVFGAAAGWWLLHERMARARLVSSTVVAAGMVMLVATR